jgi:hypothetical protein
MNEAPSLRVTEFKVEWSISQWAEAADVIALGGSTGRTVPAEYEQPDGPPRQPCRVLLELASASQSDPTAGHAVLVSNSAAIEVYELVQGVLPSNLGCVPCKALLVESSATRRLR